MSFFTGDSELATCEDHDICKTRNLTAKKCKLEYFNEIDYELTCPATCTNCKLNNRDEGICRSIRI